MDVVLDTNIIVGDFLITSGQFDVLFDYLRKTQSKLIIPEIVYEELESIYKQKLKEALEEYNKSVNKLKNMLVDFNLDKHKIEIDFEKEVKKYKDFLFKKLILYLGSEVPYRDKHLREALRRSLKRIKPCNTRGGEFRDAILWLTILEIASKNKERGIIFISNNKKDFGSKESKNSLDPELEKEALERGVKIKYYTSLSDFISDHAKKLDFITPDWIKSKLSLDEINRQLLTSIDNNGIKKLLQWADYKTDFPISDYCNPIYANLDIYNYYVYEMLNESLYIEILYTGELEVEFELEKPINDELIGVRHYVPKPEFFYPEIEVKIGGIIKDRELEGFTVLEWDIL